GPRAPRPVQPSCSCPQSQRKPLARLPLSPTPPHLPKRNSSAASPTASLHCWHSAMRRSPSWAASSTQCCRSSALARAATSSSICPRISGAATRRDRHHHRFAQEFLARRRGVSDEVVRTGGDGGRKSPNLPAQFAHVVCGSQRLPNSRDFRKICCISRNSI